MRQFKNIAVIGGGLFGSIAARALKMDGHTVTIYDNRQPQRASQCAACLMKAGWMTGLGDRAKIGMRQLELMYDVREIPFKTHPGGLTAKVWWIDPATILNQVVQIATVTRVTTDNHIHFSDGTSNCFDAVVIAAGVWSSNIIDTPHTIQAKAGCTLYYPGRTDPQIHVWAPYKQAVAFNIRDNLTWFGDGTAILSKNWTEEYVYRAIDHAKHCARLDPALMLEYRVGLRPYVKKHNGGVFDKIANNQWLLTGGAKNGTVLAGYFARRLLEDLQND